MIHLTTVPGYADVPDASLSAEDVALGSHISRISSNAAFGLVRTEVFFTLQTDGTTVPLPISPVDGYVYSRNELTYIWGIAGTGNPTTGWLTGPDNLWYCAWLVDQNTGNVSIVEWYRRSGSHDNAQQTADGTLIVYTVGQRQKSSLFMTQQASSYTDVADSALVTDAPFTQSMAQQLNRNAKLGVVNAEVLYMGEFIGGQTVPVSVSPVDGYTYSRSQVKLIFSWRWTAPGAAPFTQPDLSLGQLGPQKASINSSTGVVSASVGYIADEFSVVTHTDHGRLAVFALCSRDNLLGTFPALATSFVEQDQSIFFPGSTLRASTLLQLNKNIREAVVSAEFFALGDFHDASTIGRVTSPIDGYLYTYDEMFWLVEWSDTTNHAGVHVRVPIFWFSIDGAGHVTLVVNRLPPGGPIIDDDNTLCTISVNVIAIRGATHAVAVSGGSGNPPGGGSGGTDNNPPDINPYTITIDMGDGSQPIANQSLLKHVISAYIATAILPAALAGSVFKSRIPFTNAYVITITKNGVTIGTVNFAAGASTATFVFAADVTLVTGDVVELIGQATPDPAGSGIYGTLSASRN